MNVKEAHIRKFGAWLPLIGVLPAGLLGLGIMAMFGAPRSMPLMNVGAMLIGFVSGYWASSAIVTGAKKRPSFLAGAILILLALTFADAGLEGVHRWVRLGPLRLHSAALVMPLLLLVLVFLWSERRLLLSLAVFSCALVLHIAQPDAGQATALAAAGMVHATFRDQPMWSRITLLGIGILGAGAAWLRPDPLLGVPMVEDIVPHAFTMNVGLGIAAVIALALLPTSAIAFARTFDSANHARLYGFVLGAYLLASLIVVGVGEFPTPVLGFGASPMLGAIWGMALLGRVAREPESR